LLKDLSARQRLLAVVLLALAAGGAVQYAVKVQTPASGSPCIPDECGYVRGAPFVVGPVEDASRACGLTREYTVVGRMDPPTKTSGENPSWQINGCYYFHDTEMRQVVLALAFDSEPRAVVVPLAEVVAPETRESNFSVVVPRPNGDPIRGAYLALQWRLKR
jgi:hypothetical protein